MKIIFIKSDKSQKFVKILKKSSFTNLKQLQILLTVTVRYAVICIFGTCLSPENEFYQPEILTFSLIYVKILVSNLFSK